LSLLKPPSKPRGFKKGVSGNPAGKRKGTRDRRTDSREIVSKYTGITPLEYMLLTLQAKRSAPRERMWAAKEAAPYVHRKQPIAVETRDLTQEEKDQMSATVLKLESMIAGGVIGSLATRKKRARAEAKAAAAQAKKE